MRSIYSYQFSQSDNGCDGDEGSGMRIIRNKAEGSVGVVVNSSVEF